MGREQGERMSQPKEWVCEKCGGTCWDVWKFCAKCGTPRPQELDEILHNEGYTVGWGNYTTVKSKLLAWKDKAVKAEFNRAVALKEILNETNGPASSGSRLTLENSGSAGYGTTPLKNNLEVSSGIGKETKLVKILEHAWDTEYSSGVSSRDSCFRAEAQAAIEWFKEIIPKPFGEYVATKVDHDHGWNRYYEELLRRLE